tara:strand:+ start:1191 stop:1940 length:750 start_codon:yes stop_codon:yes gene_type:complete
MSVQSDNNKQMLFDLLKSIGFDNKIKINNSELYNFINQQCNYFHINRIDLGYGNDLEGMNKKVVEGGYNFIMSNENKETVKVENIQLSTRQVFDKNLATQENQFKKMINPKKPKKIDFSDKGEDFPIQNLDIIMNQTLADRQKELETITQKYNIDDQEKTQKWLNRDNETPKLKIEQDTNINFDSTVKINKKKRVSFNIDGGGSNKNNNLTNFLSKLKQKPIVKDDDIMNKLDIIISNQSEILKLLKSK